MREARLRNKKTKAHNTHETDDVHVVCTSEARNRTRGSVLRYRLRRGIAEANGICRIPDIKEQRAKGANEALFILPSQCSFRKKRLMIISWSAGPTMKRPSLVEAGQQQRR